MQDYTTTMKEEILALQRSEITEYHIYSALARRTKGKNADVLQRIAEEEKRHAHQWSLYTKQKVSPDKAKILFYLLAATIFGITFATNLMEQGERKAESAYERLAEFISEAKEIQKEEEEHERELLSIIDEERLRYISSMVLGLNDALVELTGTLAGLTFALAKSDVVGLAGLITGIAASLSMSASEYLAKKSDPSAQHPLKAALYTGIAYVFTVCFLIMPYFLLGNPYMALAWCLGNGALVILIFTFFVSVVREEAFKPAFLEMIGIAFGVAGVSFLIGLLAKRLLNIDV
ncbi:MAG: hypothetical protein PWR28_74 [Synergistaceae bacterium]|nr:hypothetical protein [Synergistaceae bacterium]